MPADGEAARILATREPIGWRLGLERMRRLCSLLGMPQHRFASIHVVGTNGKTSVTRMTAALLEAHGTSAGAYTSPHLRSWGERVRIGGEPISEDAFTRVLERAEQAAQVADRSAGEEGPVTQYELLTAAAFLAFAEARVQVAVIEAGLGGRLDATNVIPSKLTVLTSVGLDHTEWLGETLEEIAGEKLAVLRDHTALLTGDLPGEVKPVVAREVTDKHARHLDEPGAIWGRTTGGPEHLAGFQQQNLALAHAAAAEILGRDRDALFESDAAMLELALIPGRAQVVKNDPILIFDAAHNPDGAAALAQLVTEVASEWKPGRGIRRSTRLRRGRWVRRRDVICCLAILSEKDAQGIVEALAPACSRFVCTEISEETIKGSGRPAGKAHPAEALAELCRGAGVEAEAIGDPVQAWERAKALAREGDAAALAAGSHYLLTSIWTEKPGPSC